MSQVFIFIDLTATNIYRLLKRSISDSIHPDDSTFPGKYSSVMKFPFLSPQKSDTAFDWKSVSLRVKEYKKCLLILSEAQGYGCVLKKFSAPLLVLPDIKML